MSIPDHQRAETAMSDEEKITRRLYLLTKAMETGARNLVVMEAVASTAIEHPEWDMDEKRTWNEWEKTGG
jgi:hypothetical protein